MFSGGKLVLKAGHWSRYVEGTLMNMGMKSTELGYELSRVLNSGKLILYSMQIINV